MLDDWSNEAKNHGTVVSTDEGPLFAVSTVGSYLGQGMSTISVRFTCKVLPSCVAVKNWILCGTELVVVALPRVYL